MKKVLLFILSTGIALCFFLFVQYQTKSAIVSALEKATANSLECCPCNSD